MYLFKKLLSASKAVVVSEDETTRTEAMNNLKAVIHECEESKIRHVVGVIGTGSDLSPHQLIKEFIGEQAILIIEDEPKPIKKTFELNYEITLRDNFSKEVISMKEMMKPDADQIRHNREQNRFRQRNHRGKI